MHRASEVGEGNPVPGTVDKSCGIPEPDSDPATQVDWQEDANASASFANREGTYLDPNDVFYPDSIRRQMSRAGKRPQIPPNARRDELLFDGYDRGRPVSVDESWNVYGLDTEDTIGHFDTLDGRRLVSPSNRVAIYAPRFGQVRQVADFGFADSTTRSGNLLDRSQMLIAGGRDFSTTTKQFEQTVGEVGTSRASSFIDETRGIAGRSVTHITGLRNHYAPYENLEIMRFGRFSSAESSRLELGMQSANVWQDNLGLQVAAKLAQPVIAKDVNRVQQLEVIDTDGDNHILRVFKIASQLAARPGDEVEFSIRFDNLSPRAIGNVTLIDNLTPRLEYVPGSAECSLESDFLVSPNAEGSLQLRWEIRKPMPASSGGMIRFKCRVR